jgi:outer membrane receptor protein involved in Fe transport
VRGGSPLENLFVVDNVEIPNINNFANFASAGGTTSLLDPALIQDVTFLTGGYPASYLNRTSSVLQVTQREGSRERAAGRLTLGSAGLGGIAEGPLGRASKGSWVFSGKRSFLDAFTKDLGFGGVPVNYNFNTKAVYDLSARDRIWLVNIVGVDRIRLGATDDRSADPDRDPELDLIDVRYRGRRSATGVNWQHLFGSRGVGLLGVTDARAGVRQAFKDLLRSGPAAGTADQRIAATPANYTEDSTEAESSVKYDLTIYLPVFQKLQTGVSFKTLRASYDTGQPFGQNFPFSAQRDLNSLALKQSVTANQASVYLQSTRTFAKRLNLTWGGRLDDYRILRRTALSPRLGLSYAITEKLSWRAAFGVYYQQPLLFVIQSFAVNRGLTPLRATHYVTGFSYTLSPSSRVTVEAYEKRYRSYPVSLQFPSFSLANAGDTFVVTELLLPYISAGRGRVRGVEAAWEHKFSNNWYALLNASFSRTRFAALDGVARPGTYDYPAISNAVGGYQWRKKWDFSARLAYLSGKPYTPFDEVLSRRQNRGIYDLARVNALRAPDYARLDLRVDRTFTVRGQPLLVFFGVQNGLNRRNSSGFTWDRVNNSVRVNRQLGVFPLIGLDWRF